MKNNRKKHLLHIGIVVAVFVLLGAYSVLAEPTDTGNIIPNIDITLGKPDTPQDYVDNIKLLILLTVLTLLPSFIMMTTSFVRIIVVFSLFKNAIGVQQSIPRQVIIGLALFLTFFIMSPVYRDVNDNALKPYLAGTISQEEAIKIGGKPIKDFMLKQTSVKDLRLFLEVGNYEDTVEKIENKDGTIDVSYDNVPFQVVIPAFMISELKTAFQIGFLLFMPFIIIDIVTGSILMSMGMMMVPPVMIALPFKLLLFVMVDGWYLLTRALILSFH